MAAAELHRRVTLGGSRTSQEVLARLPDLHAELVAGSAPRSAAAKYLVGWTAGAVASAVGLEYAVSGRGLLVDRDALRFRLHGGGWVELAEHGAAPRPAASREVVDTLVAAVTPLVEACRSLARVGRVSLWNEVGDSLGMALSHGAAPHPPDPEAVRRAAELVRTPGAPWRSSPTVGIVETARGPIYVAQKGGCCLAYLTPEPALPDVGTLDPAYQRFLERFPPQRPAYCATCRFRTPEDCRERQVAWHEAS